MVPVKRILWTGLGRFLRFLTYFQCPGVFPMHSIGRLEPFLPVGSGVAACPKIKKTTSDWIVDPMCLFFPFAYMLSRSPKVQRINPFSPCLWNQVSFTQSVSRAAKGTSTFPLVLALKFSVSWPCPPTMAIGVVAEG
jgi:hypothetical protein